MLTTLPPEFWHGVEQFNQQQFYACHDTLEALWIEATEPDKTFYQGVLQIAVALYHLGNRNWRGAVILLGEGTHRLNRYQPVYEGVNVEDLMQQSATLLDELQQMGQAGVDQLIQPPRSLDPELVLSEPGQAEPLQLPEIKRAAALDS